MKKFLSLTLVVLFMVSFAAPAQAWWIFGSSSRTKDILQNVTINSIPYEQAPQELLLYPEFLPNGQLTIKGKAVANKKAADSLAISTDARATWQSVPLAADGSFSYSLRPTPGAEYAIYLKAEAEGETNDILLSGKRVKISGQSLQAAVRDTLNSLFAAYKEENSRLFMSYVSPSFAGDSNLLARAVRRDFSALDNIDLRFTVSSVAVDSKGKVAATIRYNRTAVVAHSVSFTGSVLKDSGTTQMVFVPGEQGLKLYSMKIPLLFGLSDAPNISSGTVRSSDNASILIIISRGEAGLGPVNNAEQGIVDEHHHPPHPYP